MHDPASGTFAFRNSDGDEVFVRRWMPVGKVRGTVLIAHGMAEHSARYARFATALTAAGYAAYAPDHRGHGGTANGTLGVGGSDAWNGMVRDLVQLAGTIGDAHPGVPSFFFGHSMGSILAQRFIALRGSTLSGAILSGSFGVIEGLDALVAIARHAAEGDAATQPSPLVAQMFAGFNAQFTLRTGYEWLSRDAAEVDAYVADPLCGFTFSNGLLAEMLGGFAQTWQPENEARIPTTLPILIFSGDQDPAGGNTVSTQALADRYRALGVRDLRVIFYPEARHEMLNERNRDEVERDVIAWLDAHVPARVS
jgi:alpha-beta hydrolase superfamily lysophospholipase